MSQFISTTMTMMIRGVCNESLFGDVCQQPSCDLLHLRAPVPVTDGHFHQRLLRENWFDRLALIKNVEEFIGINNNHQAFDWDQPLRPIPEGLASKIHIYQSYGIHPRYLGDQPRNDLLRLRDLIQRRPIVAVGECGLDQLNSDHMSMQREIFAEQIKLANEFHLPLILHSRQTDRELFDILNRTALDHSMKIQWHCCASKGAQIYSEFLHSFPNSVLSLGGMCCHSGEKALQRLICELVANERDPLERRFVFETDAPYLKSSSLILPSDENCPLLGTLCSSAYFTRNVLKNDQWTENLRLNTTILKKFFSLP